MGKLIKMLGWCLRHTCVSKGE